MHEGLEKGDSFEAVIKKGISINDSHQVSCEGLSYALFKKFK
jgi:hypothetical protein